MIEKLRRFLGEERGSIIILFALGLPLIILAVGGALDYTRATDSRALMQKSLDAAALAGVTGFKADETDADIEARVRRYLEANFLDQYGEDTEFKITIDRENLSVKVDADVSVPTTFLSFFTMDSIDLLVSATAEGGGQDIVVNIAMCIDATGSMGGTIRAVQDNARSFDEDLKKAIAKRGRQLDKVHVRPIYYRDYDSDPVPMIEGPFYSLPEDRAGFDNFVSDQSAAGGGDWPEAGMECFHVAMNSAWVKPENERQQIYPVVAIWTDAPADEPGNAANIGGHGVYPAGMPRTFSTMKSNWENSSVIDQDNKTGILFGPAAEQSWRTVTKWDNFIHGGGVLEGNANMVEKIADAIYQKLPPPILSR